ncbi:baseplate assembly protein [Ochrobactrum sp. MR28]|nr:baseplate assembly protein [Ochrobactrum sp. MR28]MBX8818768.1 baseplate assembly protein [Ochrobactrum sp. MR31]
MIPKTLPEQIAWIAGQIAEMKRQARNRKRTGKIAVVDHKKGLARVEISRPEGKPFLSPWVPWKEVASGGIKSHIPPTVGEQVDLVSESGDLADAVIDMSTPSNENPRPHDGPEAVITKGNSRLLIGDDEISIATTTINVSAKTTNIEGDLHIKGGKLTHNDVNIGDSHVHGGVEPGSSDTSEPH